MRWIIISISPMSSGVAKLGHIRACCRMRSGAKNTYIKTLNLAAPIAICIEIALLERSLVRSPDLIAREFAISNKVTLHCAQIQPSGKCFRTNQRFQIFWGSTPLQSPSYLLILHRNSYKPSVPTSCALASATPLPMSLPSLTCIPPSCSYAVCSELHTAAPHMTPTPPDPHHDL